MKISSSDLLAILACTSFAPSQVQAQSGVSCEFALTPQYGFGEDSDFVNPFWTWSEAEIDALPVCNVNWGTALVGDDYVRGFWVKVTTPGTADTTYPVNIETTEGYGSKFAVYKGTCDALECADSVYVAKDSDTEGQVAWDAIGGTDYYIFVNRVWKAEFENYLPVRVNFVSAWQMCDLVKKPKATINAQVDQQFKQTCECQDNGDGTTYLICQQDCTECFTTEGGGSICHYWSWTEGLAQIWGGVAASGVTDCFELGEGYENVGETICVGHSYEEGTHNQCTLSIGGDACSSCSYNPASQECPPRGSTQFTANCENIGKGTISACAAPSDGGLAGDIARLWDTDSDYDTLFVGRCRGDPVRPNVEDLTGGAGPPDGVPPTDGSTPAGDSDGSMAATELELGVPSETFALDETTPTKEFMIDVDASQLSGVRCVMSGTSGDPDMKVYEDGMVLCHDSIFGPSGDCRAGIREENTTELLVEVFAFGGNPAEGVSIQCDSFDEILALGEPSGTLIYGGEDAWFLLDVKDRTDPMNCFLVDINGTKVRGTGLPSLFVSEDDKVAVGEGGCANTNGVCATNVTDGASAHWIYVSSEAAIVDAFAVQCEPDYKVDHFVVIDEPTYFDIGPGETVTFAAEVGGGESVFCRAIEDQRNGTLNYYLNYTDLAFVMGVNVPPNLDNENNYCDSANFFGDYEEICFAFGGPFGRSVVYGTLGAGEGFEYEGEMSLTCTKPTPASIGYASTIFDVESGRYETFVMDVPSSIDQLVCTTESTSEGDIDLYIKTGKNLGSYSWDCTSIEDGANEECEVALLHYGPTTRVFVMVYGYDDVDGIVLSCNEPVEADSDLVATTKRGDPDFDW